MRRAISLWAALCVAALTGTFMAGAQPQATDIATVTVPAAIAESGNPPALLTIAKGQHSGWGHNHPLFSGADFVIRDPDAWITFWHVHTNESVPPPPVDFTRRVVIVAIQGLQPTGGGPNISLVEVEAEGPFTRVVIVDDERPGPVEVVTNPFHIVSACRALVPAMRSVIFQHLRPFPESGVVVGRVFAAPPEGDPVPLLGAHVILAREDQEPRLAMSGWDGSYFFVNVEPGEYILRAERPGFEPAEVPLAVPPETLVAHHFFLPPLPHGVIAGAVLGRPPEGEPFPLEDALVQLFHDDEEVAHRLTNDEGAFVFPHVPPGEYVLVASHEGFFPAEFLAVVEPGDVIEHVFVLEAMPPETGAFLGRVLGVLDSGREIPIPGAVVRLLTPDGEEVRRTRTNRSGEFVMRQVPVGLYVGVAAAEGWLPADAEVEIRPGEPAHHVFRLQRP